MLEQFLEKNTINELVIYEFPFINSDWKAAHHNAAISLENREEKLDEVYNQIERNLDLLGATAIEDKLQVILSLLIVKKRVGIKYSFLPQSNIILHVL